MLLTYQECLDRYGSDYQLKKEIRNGNLFMKEKGIYSTARNTSEIDVIMKKYPKAVCTGKSAFFYHSLTDVIPDHYYLATRRSDTRIKDPRVVQSFLKDDLYEAGIMELQHNNSKIRIYDSDRKCRWITIKKLSRTTASCPMSWILALSRIMLLCSKTVQRL